jgi:hypothetical protein
VIELLTTTCPVCGSDDRLTVAFHVHAVTTPDGEALVTVESYRCEEADCCVPVDDLLGLRESAGRQPPSGRSGRTVGGRR